MLSHWLNDETVQLAEEIPDWHQALLSCATPLLRTGIVTERYVPAIVRGHQQLGPYYVLAPGLAMPHARPEDGACKTGLSLLKLHRGTRFGHHEFDPVTLIVMLAAKDSYSHISLLASLAELFSCEVSLDKLRHAETREEIKKIIAQF